MNRTIACIFGVVVSVTTVAASRAQESTGLVGPAETGRFGLERMWFTQIEVDVARGHVVRLAQHVSSTDSSMVYEVVHPTGKFVFRETDLDKFGRLIGKEEAKKLAEIKLKDLRAAQIDAKPAIQLVPRITLYAVTDSGLIHAIDAETGRTRWKTAIGTSRYPTDGVGTSDKYVAAVNGSEVYLLNAANGELVWQHKVVGAPGASPVITDNLLFVPMINGAMEAYTLADRRVPPIIFRSHGRAMVQPLFTGTNVVWPTDRGHLYVSGGSQNRINFRLEAKGAIVTPATFLPPNRIIASSIDGFIYCVQETAGTLQWRFSAGEPIVSMPVPFGDTVYAVTQEGTLFAIDGELGQERWSTTRMAKVVGASRERLYCLNDVGRLTILDRQSGSRLGSLSTEFDDLPYTNKETDRIVIGTKSGRLQCFREAQQDYPLIHIVLSKPSEPAARKPIRRQSELPPTGASDPFGSSGGSDPGDEPAANPLDAGGNPEAPANAKPADPKPADDPFG